MFWSEKLKSAKNLERFARKEAGIQPRFACLLTKKHLFALPNFVQEYKQ